MRWRSDSVKAAGAKAQELAGDRTIEVAVGGYVLAAGLVDEVAMDVAPVVLGSGKRYFGSVDTQHRLEDRDVVTQGNRVLHLRYRVRRWPIRAGTRYVDEPARLRRLTSGRAALSVAHWRRYDAGWSSLWIPSGRDGARRLDFPLRAAQR